MPEWLPDFIVISILVVIFGLVIAYMIYNRVKKGSCGSCGCGCGAARSSSKLRKTFKKDFKANKAKKAQAKKEGCCCCCNETNENAEVKTEVVENKPAEEIKTEEVKKD